MHATTGILRFRSLLRCGCELRTDRGPTCPRLELRTRKSQPGRPARRCLILASSKYAEEAGVTLRAAGQRGSGSRARASASDTMVARTCSSTACTPTCPTIARTSGARSGAVLNAWSSAPRGPRARSAWARRPHAELCQPEALLRLSHAADGHQRRHGLGLGDDAQHVECVAVRQREVEHDRVGVPRAHQRLDLGDAGCTAYLGCASGKRQHERPLPVPFQELEPHEIEDVLCTYKDLFGTNAGEIDDSAVCWPDDDDASGSPTDRGIC